MSLLATVRHSVVLPPRFGPRPRTLRALPHLQLDQWPPEDITARLIESSLRLPNVRRRQSRMASPEVLALALPDCEACGPPESFIDGHEFCHLHPLPEGGVHLTLPDPLRDQVVELGWAEAHPAVKAGIMPMTLVMVYAPRDDGELRIVLHLVSESCQFAKGL